MAVATATRRAQDLRKVKNDTQEEISSIKQWVNIVRREKGLLVVEIYTDWAGPCDPMVRYLKRAKYDLPKEQQETVKCYVLSGEDVAAFMPKIGKSRPLYLFFVARGRLVDVHPPVVGASSSGGGTINPISMSKQIRKWADLAWRYELGTLEQAAGRSAKDNLDYYFPLLKDDAVLSAYKVSAEDAYLADEAAAVHAATNQAATAAAADDEEEDGEEEETLKELEDMRRQSAVRAAAPQDDAAAADENAPLLGVTPSLVGDTAADLGSTSAKNYDAPDNANPLAQPLVSDPTRPPMGEAGVVAGSHSTTVASDATGMPQQVASSILDSAMAETEQTKSQPKPTPFDATNATSEDGPSAREAVPGMDDQQLEQAATPIAPAAKTTITDVGPDATTGPPDSRGELFAPTQLIRPNEPVNPAAQAAEEGPTHLLSPSKTANDQQQLQAVGDQADADGAESSADWVAYDVEHSYARAELAALLANPVIDRESLAFDPNNALAQQVAAMKRVDDPDGREQPLVGFSHVDTTKLKASIEQDAHGFYSDLVGTQAPPRTTFTMNDDTRMLVNQPEAGRPTFGEKFVEQLVTGESASDDVSLTGDNNDDDDSMMMTRPLGLQAPTLAAISASTTAADNKLSPLPTNNDFAAVRQLTPEELAEVQTEVDEAIDRAVGSIDV